VRKSRGAAFMLALFVMAVCSLLIISILDTQTYQYSALRNTMDYDRARYLAEAGLQHALAFLEQDITWRAGLNNVEFPSGSGMTYSVVAADGANGTVVVTSTGNAGDFARRLQITLKMGG
jgi:type II secretory pathway component PulK